jgi:N utilization substance protein B
LSARRKARELVLKSLYAYESISGNPDDIMKTLAEDSGLAEKPRKFASDLFYLTITHLISIDEEIKNHTQHWDISRLALVDKNILRISICELLFMPDIPSKVSINEAIELAKKYSTEESSSFVNGILNSIFKDHKAELEA